jgi:hypothetical protein
MENSFKFLEKNSVMLMYDYDGVIKELSDNFLKKYNGRCKVIDKGYQFAIRKC